jgi:CPA2 family monovalent cation:H+ antiporter-2
VVVLGLVIMRDLVVVLAVSALAVYALRKVRLPSIVGFLVAGVLIGPGGLRVVSDQHSVEVLAEVGVIFLLFTIGLRFSVRELMHLKGLVFGAGTVQVVATTLVVGGILWLAEAGVRPALFFGTLLAMSSTAICLKLLEERGEVIALHGRLMVGILIFQDIAVVPLMLFLPLLGGTAGGTWQDALGTVGISIGMLALIFLAARFAFPWLLERVVRIRDRELFTLATMLGALGTAWACSLAGASLPLGAFLAGVVLSESRYAQQILSEMIPLRDVFASLFFVSVGMLATPAAWVADPVTIGGLLLAVVVGKAVIVAAIALAVGFGARIAVLAGLGLAQIGEFSFILEAAGKPYGLVPPGYEQPFIGVAVLSMALTPLLGLFAQRLVGRAERVAWLARYLDRGRARKGERKDHAEEGLTDHVIIVGYGLNGRNVARVLRQIGVPYHVLELNPHTVRIVRNEGDRIQYGDATQEGVLRFAGAETARALVVTIADPSATRQIVAVARRVNPNLKILVRTRLMVEMDHLLQLGADEVVAEEFETSLEVAGLVLATYGVRPGAIHRERLALRHEQYATLRSGVETRPPVHTLDALLGMAELENVPIGAGDAAEGKTLRTLDLRQKTGATVVAVEREGRPLVNPDPDLVLRPGDVLSLFGQLEQVGAARAILRGAPAPAG